MIVREGKSVFKGVAIGSIFVYRKAEKAVNKVEIEDTAAELARFQAAKEKAMGQLKGLYEKARVDVGEEEAMIFDVHQMLLDDLDYNESITGIIENDRMNAEYAVFMTGEQMAAMFLSMDDDYMRGRAADIHDISDRLISILNGTQVSPEAMPEPVIILAEDLAPSETVQFDKSKLLAIVTQKGSANSHTAILARTMNIPSLVTTDIEIDQEYHGRQAVVDGFAGLIYIDPDEETMAKMVEKKRKADELSVPLDAPWGEEDMTLADVLASDFNLEREVLGEEGEQSRKIEQYLLSLSVQERRVLMLLAASYKPREIQRLLHISKREYLDALAGIHAYENISLLF